MSSGAVPSGLSEQTLLLDSDIRDWVVLPLLVIMISAGLLRHFVGLLLKPDPKPLTKIESRAKNDMTRAVRLRSGNANFISQERWESRRRYFADKESGYLREESEWATKETEKQKEEGAAPGEIDPMNPMSMMDGMKGSMGKYCNVLCTMPVYRKLQNVYPYTHSLSLILQFLWYKIW